MPGKVTSPGTSELIDLVGASPPGMLGQGLQEHKGVSQNQEPAKGVPPIRLAKNMVCFGMLASRSTMEA